MLAGFFLALFRLNVDYRGILWSAPLSVLTVFAISWHAPWALYTTAALAVVILVGWMLSVFAGSGGRIERGQPSMPAGAGDPLAWLYDGAATILVALAGGLAVLLCAYRWPSTGQPLSVAWPWNVPIGFTVALGLGFLLARPRHAVDTPERSEAQ